MCLCSPVVRTGRCGCQLIQKERQAMQNIDHKKTALSDDASIYEKRGQRDEDKTTRQKWNELDAKGKWQFFVDYYLLKTVVIIAVIALLSSILWTSFKPRPEERLYVIILDSILDLEGTKTYFADAIEGIGYDREKDTIMLHDSLTSMSPSDASTISTYAFAGTIDVLIAPDTALQRYASGSLLAPLDDLPQHILDRIPEENRFYYTNEKTGELHFYGVRLDDTVFYQSLNKQKYDREYVFSIVGSGQFIDNAVKLLDYMLSQTP